MRIKKKHQTNERYEMKKIKTNYLRIKMVDKYILKDLLERVLN